MAACLFLLDAMLRVRKKMQSEDIDLFGHLAQSVFARPKSLPAISDGSGDRGEEDVLRAGNRLGLKRQRPARNDDQRDRCGVRESSADAGNGQRIAAR